MLPQGPAAAEGVKYTDKLGKWFTTELEKSFSKVSPVQYKLMLGCAVWGERYVRRFLEYGVPSLRARGNLPALVQSGDAVTIVIHTDKDSLPILQSDRGLAALEMLGVVVDIHIIPQEIIEETPNDPKNKYRLIGGAHNLHMKMAKYARFGYHMLMPDHIYSENYFSGLRGKRNYDAVVHGGLSATIEEIGPILTVNGVLSADSRELNGMAWKALHEMFKPYIMNGRDVESDSPVCTHMLFSSKDYVHILSPHHSIAYLSHAALMRGPIRLFNTIDSQLPYFISESMSVYIPTPDDDMSYIEISDRQKELVGAPEPSDLLMFSLQFWLSNFCEVGFLRFLDMDNILALPDEYEHPVKPMSEKNIYKTKRKVRKTVRESRDKCMAAIRPELRNDPLKDRA